MSGVGVAVAARGADVSRAADDPCAAVKTLVLYHLSIRYDRPAALPRLRAQVAASGFQGDCWLLDEDQWIPLR